MDVPRYPRTSTYLQLRDTHDLKLGDLGSIMCKYTQDTYSYYSPGRNFFSTGNIRGRLNHDTILYAGNYL